MRCPMSVHDCLFRCTLLTDPICWPLTRARGAEVTPRDHPRSGPRPGGEAEAQTKGGPKATVSSRFEKPPQFLKSPLK